MRSKGRSENNDIKFEGLSSISPHRTPIEAYHKKVKKRRAARKAAGKARTINR